MTASVTNSFREHLLTLLKSDIDSDGVPYHIGIAQPDSDASITLNSGSMHDQSKFRHTLQSVKVLSNVSYVVPTVTWQSEVQYEAYDNNNPIQTNFYVINSAREVFLCIEQGKNADGSAGNSFIEPTSTRANQRPKTFQTGDGYLWRYMYKMSNLAYGTFRTKTYTPVKQVTNRSTTIPEEISQIGLQDSSTPGQILNIAVDNGGVNYTSPTITISGNGSGAQFFAEVFDNKIVNIRCDSNGLGDFLHGTNYDYAQVVVTDPGGGSGAKLRAVLSSRDGVNKDPVSALKCREIMLQTDFIGTEENTIVANGTDFRQVGVIKGLEKYTTDSDFTGNTGQATKKLTLQTIQGAASWVDNVTFTDALETTTAKVFDLDGTTLYYYQDEETGFENFSVDQNIKILGVEGATANIVNLVNPDVDAYSGDILYINTLASAVVRSAEQTEDIRIVIQLG
jgi:hypothetical protein